MLCKSAVENLISQGMSVVPTLGQMSNIMKTKLEKSYTVSPPVTSSHIQREMGKCLNKHQE